MDQVELPVKSAACAIRCAKPDLEAIMSPIPLATAGGNISGKKIFEPAGFSPVCRAAESDGWFLNGAIARRQPFG
jgi:hypothetical protein